MRMCDSDIIPFHGRLGCLGEWQACWIKISRPVGAGWNRVMFSAKTPGPVRGILVLPIVKSSSGDVPREWRRCEQSPVTVEGNSKQSYILEILHLVNLNKNPSMIQVS
jgi:hypothetical protein